MMREGDIIELKEHHQATDGAFFIEIFTEIAMMSQDKLKNSKKYRKSILTNLLGNVILSIINIEYRYHLRKGKEGCSDGKGKI